MRANLSKIGMVRITIVTVLGVCVIVGAVMFGVRAYQALFQQSCEDDYD